MFKKKSRFIYHNKKKYFLYFSSYNEILINMIKSRLKQWHYKYITKKYITENPATGKNQNEFYIYVDKNIIEPAGAGGVKK